MVSGRVRVVGNELAAVGRTAWWLPSRLLERDRAFDPNVAHPTPVVFVHGFCGDHTNFRAIERRLGARGVANVAYFDYRPRLDWPRLATRLGHEIDALRAKTGARRVDVVGHSLGGLVARYLVEMRGDVPVRRLVTLASPYAGARLAANELAVYGAHDPIVTPPHPAYGPHATGGRVVVADCGHWGVLVDELTVREVGRFLTSPDLALTHGRYEHLLDRAC